MLQKEQIKEWLVEIMGVENKGAQDGSQECSVFFVWSGYLKMCQNKGAQDGSQECSVFFVWPGYLKMCQNPSNWRRIL